MNDMDLTEQLPRAAFDAMDRLAGVSPFAWFARDLHVVARKGGFAASDCWVFAPEIALKRFLKIVLAFQSG